jgi:hypothetical protein
MPKDSDPTSLGLEPFAASVLYLDAMTSARGTIKDVAAPLENPADPSRDYVDDPVQLLESFVVENADLLDLERRIGRFNIFDALQIARVEIRHSNFLAWLLDPGESHGLGSLFLRAVLMNLLRECPPSRRPFSPLQLDGEELQGVEIRREWRNIDLLIICQHPSMVIAIENKIDSGEHSGQLSRYREVVAQEFPQVPESQRLLVYLTRDGDEASQEDWACYSYQQLHAVLTRVRDSNASSIGDEVRVFLDHYLSLIGSRFMNNPEIDQLCRRIYQNHRQAIDLIVERVASPTRGLAQCLEEAVEAQPERWIVINQTSKKVQFIPVTWKGLFPKVGRRETFESEHWLVLSLVAGERWLRSEVTVWPTTDTDLRAQVIARLTKDPREFGLRVFSEKIMSTSWTTLSNRKFQSVPQDDPNTIMDIARGKALEELDHLWTQLEPTPAALKPIFHQWASRNPSGQ